MEIINFIQKYWVQILFVCGVLGGMYRFMVAMVESSKCSLRNDILNIYDRCKQEKKITKFQLEALTYSYKQYKALKGNSFIDSLYQKIQAFEVED